ncbi:MAG: response regulator transcription factor [Melioribacteraceae bacterium]|nr:response regulator transcription factor [Melioribacteraceae bacterium]MCF8353107.1 response regulator transcription factor [Melioribacteraceae bacterium]MCF8392747.1 response regulator transcription factor [Melioribacteraceae bacterium]MCF8418278.1 response regulator transcription factor [Melioribacteraceae bacterium]
MKSRILLVDDEKDIIEFLQYNLEQENFNVITAGDGEEAIRKLVEKPDIIILDVMMPKIDGYKAFERIRETPGFESIPIIFLTAKSSEIDEIHGLNLGASDFIQKPISPKVLVARVKSNLRKSEKGKSKKLSGKLVVGPLEIDHDRYEITLAGKPLILPKKEFEILAYLASHPGKVFPREQILTDVWGTDVFVVERTIDVHVRKIREKFEQHSNLIETVKGVGYRFKSIE